MKWFYAKNGQQVGPVDFSEIQALHARGELTGDDLIWEQGTPNWIKLSAALTPDQTGTTTITQAKKTDALAIVSFILSIPGILCCGIGMVFAIPAVICGHVSLARIAANPLLGGKGFAVTGLILGYISVVFSTVYLVYMLFFGGMDEVMRALNEAQQARPPVH